jgi:UDP-N-acetylmuramate--alanine ligase
MALNSYGGFTFVARKKENGNCSTPLGQVVLQVPGNHNVLNALAAMAVASEMDIDTLAAGHALSEYRGASRRFELLGEAQGITIIDDYAHHPTEIRATLAAARARFALSRIWAVWQPHTYSRTRTLFEAFSQSFTDADQVIVTDVYAAREPEEKFPLEMLVNAMHHPSARYIPGLVEVEDVLLDELQPGDVVLVLSAGDADSISKQVFSKIKNRETQP